MSRIYLGIHWHFDATEGIEQGTDVANFVFKKLLRPADGPPTEGAFTESWTWQNGAAAASFTDEHAAFSLALTLPAHAGVQQDDQLLVITANNAAHVVDLLSFPAAPAAAAALAITQPARINLRQVDLAFSTPEVLDGLLSPGLPPLF